jgi:hypothetical protein
VSRDRGLENVQENGLIFCSSFCNSFQINSCLITFPVACVGPLVFLRVVRFWIFIKFGVLRLLHALTNFGRTFDLQGQIMSAASHDCMSQLNLTYVVFHEFESSFKVCVSEIKVTTY